MRREEGLRSVSRRLTVWARVTYDRPGMTKPDPEGRARATPAFSLD
jgi:hypothetical protein